MGGQQARVQRKGRQLRLLDHREFRRVLRVLVHAGQHEMYKLVVQISGGIYMGEEAGLCVVIVPPLAVHISGS